MLDSMIRPVPFRMVLGMLLVLFPIAALAAEPPAGKRLKKRPGNTQKVRAESSKGKKAQRATTSEGKRAQRSAPVEGKRAQRAKSAKGNRAERTQPTKGKRAERTVPITGKRGHRSPRDEGKRVRKARPKKSYVKTRRSFRHIRVAKPLRRNDGRINVRKAMARSTRIKPIFLHRFGDHRRDQIRRIIGHFHEGRRHAALQLWGTFVDNLVDYDLTIDLDDLMLYVVREGFQRSDATFAFRAARLEFLRESQYRLTDYVDELFGRRDSCRQQPYDCGPDTLRDMQAELIRARGELELMELRVREASAAFDSAISLSHEYETRFGSAYEDMYNEIELRIRFSP